MSSLPARTRTVLFLSLVISLAALVVSACGDDKSCPDDIEGPADFEGCVVGFKGVIQAEFLAMLAANDLTTDDVELVATGFNPTVLSEKQLDVYPVFLSNEPDTLERVIGVPIRVFQAADYGVPTLGVTYVVSEDLLANAEKREALRRFLVATMRGFQFALEDPEAAIAATQVFIAADADLVHERFILDTELGNAVSALTDANGLGWFTPEQFQVLHDVLRQYDALAEVVEIPAAMDRSFLETIYQDGELRFPATDAPPPSERLSLTFMAGFRAQANLPFVAVYVAQEQGFFDAVGIDVTIRHSVGQGEHVRLLLAGEVDVTTQPASELLERRADPGAPLVAVALFGQTGDLGYAVLTVRD